MLTSRQTQGENMEVPKCERYKPSSCHVWRVFATSQRSGSRLQPQSCHSGVHYKVVNEGYASTSTRFKATAMVDDRRMYATEVRNVQVLEEANTVHKRTRHASWSQIQQHVIHFSDIANEQAQLDLVSCRNTKSQVYHWRDAVGAKYEVETGHSERHERMHASTRRNQTDSPNGKEDK